MFSPISQPTKEAVRKDERNTRRKAKEEEYEERREASFFNHFRGEKCVTRKVVCVNVYKYADPLSLSPIHSIRNIIVFIRPTETFQSFSASKSKNRRF